MTPSPSVYIGCVLYRPKLADLETLLAAMEPFKALGQVMFFDNTPDVVGDGLSKDGIRAAVELAGCRYATDQTNVGTAGGLNCLLSEALSGGAEWLLYFDQDSRPRSGFVDAVRVRLRDCEPSVAAIGSRIEGEPHSPRPRFPESGVVPVSNVIASGTAYRVVAVRGAGGFGEALGLDLVDHEICLRLRLRGGVVLRDNSWRIVHAIGEGGRWLPRLNLQVQRHPPWRRRLMWRNTVVVVRLHWRSAGGECGRLLVGRLIETLLGALVFRDWRFITSAVLGVWDGLSRKAIATPPRLP